MHLWDRILPQAVITLNMIRTSRVHPKLSAATHIFGQHDYARAPMAPPGTRIIAHETPGRRKTWAPHGQDGWYIGPALEHYRCYTVYITKTRCSRIVETVEFFPHQFEMPFPSSSDLATQDAAELTHALLNLQPAGPFCQVGDEQAITLRKLATIFEASKPNKVSKKLTPQNTPIILLPEMANAVICPETGKSLKHQELITKLKYKIKWMRSTANEINRLYNTYTTRFIRRSDIPQGRKVTYGSFVVDIKDHNKENHA
jgi:hypothetical protein